MRTLRAFVPSWLLFAVLAEAASAGSNNCLVFRLDSMGNIIDEAALRPSTPEVPWIAVNGSTVTARSASLDDAGQFISFSSEGNRVPARVVSLHGDPATGQVSVVVEVLRTDGPWVTRLTPEQVADIRVSSTAQQSFRHYFLHLQNAPPPAPVRLAVELPQATLANGQQIAVAGDGRFISYAPRGVDSVPRLPARVRRIWTDPQGQLHVVVDDIGDGGNIVARELTPVEIAEARRSGTSQSSFAGVPDAPPGPGAMAPRLVPAPPVPAPTPVSVSVASGRLPNGEKIGTARPAESYVSFPLGAADGARAHARVRRLWTEGGLLHVEVDEIVGGGVVTRELTPAELAHARRGSQRAFDSALAALGAVPAPPPVSHARPLSVAERQGAVGEIFGPNPPSRTRVDPTLNNRTHPRTGNPTPFGNKVSDRAYGVRANRIFDDVSPAVLPRGQRYTFVVTADGRMSFGQVIDGWEFGVKHMHIANGRPIVSAGELEVLADGTLAFNMESGTFTLGLVNKHGVDPIQLQERTRQLFAREVGDQRVRVVGASDVLTKAPPLPSSAELARLCADALFLAINEVFCR